MLQVQILYLQNWLKMEEEHWSRNYINDFKNMEWRNTSNRMNKGICPITLLNTAHMVSAILLNKKFANIVEKKKLEECQMGLCPNKSTTDNIFITRQIFGKFYKYRSTQYICWLYTGFYSIYRNIIIRCFKQYEVPTKPIRLIQLTLTNIKATVTIHNGIYRTV